jgi:hypothetical protein
MLMDHIPRCMCSWYIIQLHDRVVHMLEELMLEARARGAGFAVGGPPYLIGSFSRSTWGCGLVRLRGSKLTSCCLFCYDQKCSHGCTNTIVPQIGARLPLPCTLALGFQNSELDASLRTCALRGTLSVQAVYEFTTTIYSL